METPDYASIVSEVQYSPAETPAETPAEDVVIAAYDEGEARFDAPRILRGLADLDRNPADVLRGLARSNGSRTYRAPGPDEIHLGPIAAPASPEGLAVLRRARVVARRRMDHPELDPSSPLCGLRLVALVDGVAVSVPDYGFRLGPRPAPLAHVGLVGAEISDPNELVSNAGWCDDGVARFCRRHGIDYEERGAECDSCGAACDEGGGIDVSPFVLTAEMVEDAPSDVLEAISTYLGVPTDWEELPTPDTDGPGYPIGWRFVPDAPDDVEGEQWPELARYLVAHAELRLLPGIDGDLVGPDGSIGRWRDGELVLRLTSRAELVGTEEGWFLRVDGNRFSVRDGLARVAPSVVGADYAFLSDIARANLE